MKLFKLMMFIFAIGFSSSSHARSMQCDSWLLSHNWQTGERTADIGRADEEWLFSYLSSKASKENENMSKFTDKEDATLLMGKYCYKNTLLKLDEAADQVFEEMKSK
jgi:hypothetical protein